MKQDKLRIALLHTSLDVRGGAEKQLLNLARELKKRGHLVTIYVSKLDKKACYNDLMQDLEIIECGGYGYKNKKKETLLSPFFMKKMGDKIKDCDVINCHNFPTIYAAYHTKKRLKVPIVWMCNEPAFPPLYIGSEVKYSISSLLYRLVVFPFLLFNKKVIGFIDKIVVLDQMNKLRIKKTFKIEPEVVWTGIDRPEILSSNLNLNLSSGKTKIKLFTVSRLDRQRRIKDIILLAGLMKEKKIPFNISIAGSGPEKENLEKLCENKDVKREVKFLGRITNEELYEEYSKCNVVLFTPENQSWGLVPLEAGFFGKPSIISNGCGVAEVFTDSVNAKIYIVGDVNDLFKKLEYFILDKSRITKMGDLAREFVTENFSWENYAKSMESLFFDVVKNNEPKGLK